MVRQYTKTPQGNKAVAAATKATNSAKDSSDVGKRLLEQVALLTQDNLAAEHENEQLQNRIDELEQWYEAKVLAHNELLKKYTMQQEYVTKLECQYVTKNLAYQELSEKYTELQNCINELETAHTKLFSDWSQLQADYTMLQEQSKAQLEQTTKLRHMLQRARLQLNTN